MKQMRSALVLVVLGWGMLLLQGCAIQPRILKPQETTEARKLVVFLDGTANDERSDTNIQKLHALVTLQKRSNISTFYAEGVGANAKVVGMATGWGIGHRTRLAYQYLAENYRVGDQIFLFGYSRGAYSARMLAAMLYYGGLPSQRPLEKTGAEKFVDLVFTAFKGDFESQERRQRIAQAIEANHLPAVRPVNVTFMGLWDTVEALALPDYEENTDLPNTLYGDQLCNVMDAAHALAADDDRARIFTPILLTTPHLWDACKAAWSDTSAPNRALDKIVDEVWFYGAHSDVGGGYQNKLIGGVSLNWMIQKIERYCLVPPQTAVPEDRMEQAEDPEAGLLWGTLYRQRARNLRAYADRSSYRAGRLQVHASLVERMQVKLPRPNEINWTTAFPECFQKNRRVLDDTRNGCKLKKVGASN